MSEVYGDLYDERPELIINERHKSSGLISELAEIAKSLNYRVSYQQGRFRHDMVVSEYQKKPKSMTYLEAKRYFKNQ